eukprot:TRINITY_DN43990_c0_g1_i1.p1 TRINITY_DN43990_c0_g1~~TRINITY_DN43990_c0_g1_i1.p1  ORF type:complete len:383 (+),score=31.01 TRINITY_DN43990_c0_g1_i1:61-1209(+)
MGSEFSTHWKCGIETRHVTTAAHALSSYERDGSIVLVPLSRTAAEMVFESAIAWDRQTIDDVCKLLRRYEAVWSDWKAKVRLRRGTADKFMLRVQLCQLKGSSESSALPSTAISTKSKDAEGSRADQKSIAAPVEKARAERSEAPESRGETRRVRSRSSPQRRTKKPADEEHKGKGDSTRRGRSASRGRSGRGDEPERSSSRRSGARARKEDEEWVIEKVEEEEKSHADFMRQVFESPVNKVMPYLYIGNVDASQDYDILHKLGIRAILNCTPDVPNSFEKQGVTYYRIPVLDTPDAQIKPYFEPSMKFIHSFRELDRGVLVHCHWGMSRSASVVLAYLMWCGKFAGFEEALSFLRERRPVVHPNNGFRRQLEEFRLEVVCK